MYCSISVLITCIHYYYYYFLQIPDQTNKEKVKPWNGAFHRYCVGLIVEMWDVTCGGCVPGSPYSQLMLQHARHSVFVSQWTTEVEGELLLESMVATLRSGQHSGSQMVASSAAATPRRVHQWGTPMCIGLCLVQLSSVAPQSARSNMSLPPLQAEALLDNIQLEWSPELALLVTAILRYN